MGHFKRFNRWSSTSEGMRSSVTAVVKFNKTRSYFAAGTKNCRQPRGRSVKHMADAKCFNMF